MLPNNLFCHNYNTMFFEFLFNKNMQHAFMFEYATQDIKYSYSCKVKVKVYCGLLQFITDINMIFYLSILMRTIIFIEYCEYDCFQELNDLELELLLNMTNSIFYFPECCLFLRHLYLLALDFHHIKLIKKCSLICTFNNKS